MCLHRGRGECTWPAQVMLFLVDTVVASRYLTVCQLLHTWMRALRENSLDADGRGDALGHGDRHTDVARSGLVIEIVEKRDLAQRVTVVDRI